MTSAGATHRHSRSHETPRISRRTGTYALGDPTPLEELGLRAGVWYSLDGTPIPIPRTPEVHTP